METLKTTIPLRIELEYMLDQRRLVRDLSQRTIVSLGQRQDSDELLSFLGLTAPQVLDTRKLRMKLRAIARAITNEKLDELSRLLGKPLRYPMPGTISKWIDDQVEAIQYTVEHWLLSADETVRKSRLKGMAYADMTIALREKAKEVAGVAEQRASVAVLQLNSQLIEEIAAGAGSTHYRWHTMGDDRVRVNHAALADTIQSWNDPPLGGGTKPPDHGHPGSGYGCRCLPIPLQGPPGIGVSPQAQI